MKPTNYPYKLRDGLTDSRLLFEIAQRHFGTPIQSQQSTDVWDTAPRYTYIWKLYDNFIELNLTISHHDGYNFIDIYYDLSNVSYFSEPNTSEGFCSTTNLISRIEAFNSEVKKPWSEFTFDEMAQSAAFIYFYYTEEGTIADDLHQVMVLKSYKEPENQYIKKYFDAIKKAKV